MQIILTNKLGIERKWGDKNPVQWASQPGKDIWVFKQVFCPWRPERCQFCNGYATTNFFKFIFMQCALSTQQKQCTWVLCARCNTEMTHIFFVCVCMYTLFSGLLSLNLSCSSTHIYSLLYKYNLCHCSLCWKVVGFSKSVILWLTLISMF